MRRFRSTPRQDWPQRVESQGLQFHTQDGIPYWDESAFYEFRSAEIDAIEKATETLNDLCVQAVETIFRQDQLDRFLIPPGYHDYLRRSWERDDLSLYGRFDFRYDGHAPPKLLEYNADTPTGLLEAAVIQWYWLQDVFPESDQFNSIHEKLLEFWPRLGLSSQDIIHFAAMEGHLEDFMTVTYLRDTAQQAGCKTVYLPMEKVGWNAARRAFVDLQEVPIRTAFKLYPHEWMFREEFGPHLLECQVRWLEPPWKVLLSNKMILVLLWELFPDCPYLLPAGTAPLSDQYVCKPCQGREGANVAIVDRGHTTIETEGPYGDEPVVYQQLFSLPEFDGNYPVVGSWIVNGNACGMGIREDRSPITTNSSRFIPHRFR